MGRSAGNFLPFACCRKRLYILPFPIRAKATNNGNGYQGETEMNINVVGTSGSGKSTLARRLAHAAPGGVAGREPGVAPSGAVAGNRQPREFPPFVLQPGIHHPLDAENLAAESPTLSGRYAGSAISSYSLRPATQSSAGRGAAPRAGSAAVRRAYLIFSSTHVN